MWIILDPSVSELTSQMVDEITGLETVLLSIARGEHAIAVRVKDAKPLYDLALSNISKATLQAAASNAAEYLAQSAASTHKIHVILSGQLTRLRTDGEWEISLSTIFRNGMPKSVLLAENITDAEVLKYSALHYQKINKIQQTLNLQLLGGGGADTPKTLGSLISQKLGAILCITDSDRTSPRDSTNQTSRDCQNAIMQSAWISSHKSLDERETENHVPITILEDTVAQPGFKESLHRLNEIKELQITPEQWKYLDLKEGTYLKKVINNSCFWASAIISSIQAQLISENCGHGVNDSVQGSKCTCLISPGIAEKILEHVLVYLDKNSVSSTANRVKNAQNVDGWLGTGKSISDWGAALQKRRI